MAEYELRASLYKKGQVCSSRFQQTSEIMTTNGVEQFKSVNKLSKTPARHLEIPSNWNDVARQNYRQIDKIKTLNKV